MAKFHQGKFKPKNPSKYIGDVTNIVYRSGWELKVFARLDSNPNVIRWGSEEFIINYKSPIDGRNHRYFPDVYIETKDAEGKKKIMIVEIKPYSQTSEPNVANKLTTKGKLSKRYLNEVATYGVNKAKWAAAEAFCAERGWEFLILTEKDIFGK